MANNLVNFEAAELFSNTERGHQARLHTVAAFKLYRLLTPPEEREKGVPEFMLTDPMCRQFLELDGPMGTPEQINEAMREWLDTMPAHKRAEYIKILQ
jgi:hypothetical protein